MVVSVSASGCPESRTLDDVGTRPDARVSEDAPPIGPDAWAPPTADLDLLFVIDNSNSMAEEQANFIAELPRLVSVLASGDGDGDGTRDFQPTSSMHIGVVTTDMGAGPVAALPTCAPGLGDDGILISRSRITTPSCPDSYPSGVFEFDRATDDALATAAAVGCVANLGTGGCGFEQQLEATLKAVSPSTATAWTAPGYLPPRFSSGDGIPDSLPGHGDRTNAGFLRAGSILAIVLITDEEDCSLRDYALLGSEDSRFTSVPFNLRCNTFGDPALGVVHDVQRYVDGLRGLRANPRDLVFAAVVGIPPEIEPLAGATPDFAGILAHPQMVPRPDAMGRSLEPSCSSANGVAYPPVRIVQVAAGLAESGALVGLSSICTTSFRPALDGILTRLAERFPSP
jgi:hypothetical protein